MARASMGIRVAVVCTAVSALWLAAGPAQAGVGDVVDGAVGSAGGDAVQDTVNTVGDGVDDTVGQVTGSADAVLQDTVREVTEPVKPSSQDASPDAGDDATKPSQAAAGTQRDVPRAVVPKPRNDLATAAADTSSNAPPQRQKAHGRQPVRERSSAERGSRQVADALAPHVRACESESLAVRDLRRCARAGTSVPGPVPDVEVAGKTASKSLPGLGGPPRILLPAGLLMVGMGLVLVARGRRGTCVVPAA